MSFLGLMCVQFVVPIVLWIILTRGLNFSDSLDGLLSHSYSKGVVTFFSVIATLFTINSWINNGTRNNILMFALIAILLAIYPQWVAILRSGMSKWLNANIIPNLAGFIVLFVSDLILYSLFVVPTMVAIYLVSFTVWIWLNPSILGTDYQNLFGSLFLIQMVWMSIYLISVKIIAYNMQNSSAGSPATANSDDPTNLTLSLSIFCRNVLITSVGLFAFFILLGSAPPDEVLLRFWVVILFIILPTIIHVFSDRQFIFNYD